MCCTMVKIARRVFKICCNVGKVVKNVFFFTLFWTLKKQKMRPQELKSVHELIDHPLIQNPLCRFVCVCRKDMRRRAFESPDLALCFEYLHHGCWKLRKFFTAPQRSGTHFFLDSVHSLFQNLEISGSQKSEFWWSKWLEKKKNF